jgi:hypothetical protein
MKLQHLRDISTQVVPNIHAISVGDMLLWRGYMCDWLLEVGVVYEDSFMYVVVDSGDLGARLNHIGHIGRFSVPPPTKTLTFVSFNASALDHYISHLVSRVFL